MNEEEKYINNIIGILLAFSIMAAVLSIFVKFVALNKFTYVNILDKSDAYKQVTDVVYEKIDAAFKAKNINYDIKKDIITEDDIKREADSAITGIIEYLETGENNVKPIDTQIYKQRVADILHSTLSTIIKPAGSELSFNDNLNIQNTACITSNTKLNEMVVTGQGGLQVERLMSRSEAEARVREILKQKGLTVDQAIAKAQKKGITEEQALKILAGYGITIDDEPEQNETSNGTSGGSNSQVNDNGNASEQNSNNTSGDYSNGTASNSNEEGSAAGTSANPNTGTNSNTSAKSQVLDKLENKLLNEADSSIEKEVEKVNFNKILESDKFKKLAKITSIIYKMFWLFMILPIIFMAILIKINRKNLNYGLKQIGRAFLSSGLLMSVIFACAYVFKVYEKINIGPAYFKDTASYAIKHFSIILSTYGIITFTIGFLMFIPMIIKSGKHSKKLSLIK